ncbi:MAG: hypothetical protein HY716_11900 [Planctomycetes bacterium]|nr:hypothetical protein [Planctomycetota bacterium]
MWYASIITTCILLTSSAWAQEPVRITSTADFEQGNNEGLVSTAGNKVRSGIQQWRSPGADEHTAIDRRERN